MDRQPTHILNSILIHYTEWKSGALNDEAIINFPRRRRLRICLKFDSFNKKTEHLVQQLWLSIFYHYSFTLYLCCSLYWYSILCNNVIDIIILLLPLATATEAEEGERDTIYNDNIFISMFVVGKTENVTWECCPGCRQIYIFMIWGFTRINCPSGSPDIWRNILRYNETLILCDNSPSPASFIVVFPSPCL